MSDMNEIICGDCLEILRGGTIEDKSIDLVVTDPPYKIQFVGKGSLADKYDSRKPAIEGIGSNKDFDLIPFLEVIRPKLKKMNMYVWMSKGSLPETFDWIRKYDYFYDLLIWSKVNPIPATNFKYLSDIEYCMFIRETGATWNNGLGYEIYKKVMRDNLQSLPGHPTPKPLWMMMNAIKISSKENDVILDPFLGSGTTALAAKYLKRNFIGIEISEKYCELAKQRLRQDLLL